ncbi:c-type cytochrome [Tropicimonas sp. TH_r6]|uniref:c-type cytochrome n=1 Tax=Tropicimonas sp. TH_r6 TaxID=3082085 RepID=UPI0029535ACA|nr:c-type cytochrome [Tropicimonas sp. TH_r6]MDV7143006.1 c-type cytochrome [Tropicimonas sp. TH_r6]
MSDDEARSNRGQIFVYVAVAVGVLVFGLADLAGMTGNGRSGWPSEFEGNGERIYFTGRSESGESIRSFGGNQHMLMMRGYACASCHGAEREGARLWPGLRQSAPAITPEALAEEHAQDGHAHESYSRASLAHAISEGVRPDGSVIGDGMPRWSLSDRDMQDLVSYLLPEEAQSH